VILPAFCTSGRPLVPQGVVVHYFSGRNVDPEREFELDVCRNLFLDLNRPRSARQHYMQGPKWPEARMYASAHVLIGRAGEVWKLVEFDLASYHAGKSIMNGRPNCNAFALGVELVGSITSKFTDRQYAALAALLTDLMRRFGFAREWIAGHDAVRWAAIQAGESAKPKYDPSGRKDGRGDNFSWERLWRLLDDEEARSNSSDVRPAHGASGG
jgi:N-acetyl-anhydromuramyl-L-alanine amidase AmpD